MLGRYRNNENVSVVHRIGVAKSAMYDVGGGLMEMKSFKYIELTKEEIIQKIKEQNVFTKSGFAHPFTLELH